MAKGDTEGVKIVCTNKKARRDYHIEDKIEAGLVLMGSEVKSLYRGYLPSGTRVKRGFKKMINATDDDDLFEYETLRDHYGLLCDAPWFQALSIPDKLIAYLQKALKTGKLSDAKRIEITTIHSTKGREADNVVIIPDMGWLTWNAFQKNPDVEHRTAYVACTRAKKHLYLHYPITNNFYDYPRT